MPAVPSPLDPVTDPEPATSVTTSLHSSWYDPDASAWEPQPPALFEALRASPPRPTIAVAPARHAPSQDRSRRARRGAA